MNDIRLQILGSGSAVPTKQRNQSAQVLTLHNKSFLIDCGEGTQIQMVKHSVPTGRMSHIFISHLHGDHCFGLMGLLSTLGMRGHGGTVVIHSHPKLEQFLRPVLDYFCRDLTFNVEFASFSDLQPEAIYEDKSLTVTTIPLKHSLPSNGFLFREKEKERHIIREKIDFYNVPVREIPRIKQGADFVTAEGIVVPNKYLTVAASPPFSYAYCSDTMYTEKFIPIIEKVDVLYHEATFLHEHLSRATSTMHSTSIQAATIAQKAQVGKLIIGHFSARYEKPDGLLREAQSIFPNTEIAEDGKIFSLA